jgi:hypothetical protein
MAVALHFQQNDLPSIQPNVNQNLKSIWQNLLQVLLIVTQGIPN